MTRLEFVSLCGTYLIDPAIVLENEAIVKALKERDDSKVIRLVKTKF